MSRLLPLIGETTLGSKVSTANTRLLCMKQLSCCRCASRVFLMSCEVAPQRVCWFNPRLLTLSYTTPSEFTWAQSQTTCSLERTHYEAEIPLFRSRSARRGTRLPFPHHVVHSLIIPTTLSFLLGACKRPGLAGVPLGCCASQSTTQTSKPSSLVTAALTTLKRAGGPTSRGRSMASSFVTHSSLHSSGMRLGIRHFNRITTPKVPGRNQRMYALISRVRLTYMHMEFSMIFTLSYLSMAIQVPLMCWTIRTHHPCQFHHSLLLLLNLPGF